MSSGQSKQALAPLASTDLLEPIFPLYSHCSQARCSAGTARERGCHTSPRIGHRQWKQGIRPHKAAADRLETDLKQCWNPNITCMAPAFACVGCWRIPRLFIKCPCYSRSRVTGFSAPSACNDFRDDVLLFQTSPRPTTTSTHDWLKQTSQHILNLPVHRKVLQQVSIYQHFFVFYYNYFYEPIHSRLLYCNRTWWIWQPANAYVRPSRKQKIISYKIKPV